jgi:aminopeptidase-like protein
MGMAGKWVIVDERQVEYRKGETLLATVQRSLNGDWSGYDHRTDDMQDLNTTVLGQAKRKMLHLLEYPVAP